MTTTITIKRDKTLKDRLNNLALNEWQMNEIETALIETALIESENGDFSNKKQIGDIFKKWS